jgi:hypothetical protein
MKVIALILTLVSTSAFAIGYEQYESKFTISDRTSYGQVYYNCDSVEIQTEKMLEKLGAIDIEVKCNGGLDRWGHMHMPARVKATYSALSSSIDNDTNMTVGIYSEKLRERGKCHLLNSIFKSVKKNFELTSYSMRSCMRSNSHALIKFDVIKEN